MRLGLLQCRADGLNQLRNGGLALLQRSLGRNLVAPQCLAGEFEEHLTVGAQGLPRQRIKRLAQPCLGLLEQGDSIGLLASCGLQAHAGRFKLDTNGFNPARRAQLRHQGTQHYAH